MIYLEIIFWISFIALAHTYVIYPLLLQLLSFFKKNNEHVFLKTDIYPSVSILIPAHNEEAVIEQKLSSIVATDYPQDKMEVLIGSDASTDRTNELVEALGKKHTHFKLINFPSRSGKIRIINQLQSIAKYEILILTDANVLFDKNTIHELVKHFHHPQIALVDSNMRNSSKQDQGISKAENTYIRGEVGIKHTEGRVFGMMMGPFGGCYAVRKKFYTSVPENFLVDDFYINMKVLEQGGKAISEINAKVYEENPSDWKVEFKRKIRIATGSFQNFSAFFHLLWKFNTLSFCFLSHKVLRWFGPFFMIGLYFSSFALLQLMNSNELPINMYLMLFLLQNFILVVFLFDLLLKSIGINFLITRIVTHFLTTNLALLIGFFRFIFGVKSSVWQPTKR